MDAIISNLRWSSDWNGYEVGYDDIPVVGLYYSDRLRCSFYVNTEDGEVMECMPNVQEGMIE